MRAFLALLPDRDSALAIDAWRERAWPDIGRAVPMQNLHLTLCFLGEQPRARIDALVRLLDDARPGTFSSGRRDMVLDAAGWRPDSQVAWLEAGSAPGAIAGLAKSMRTAAGRAGIRTDKRPFLPHVTVARGVAVPPPPPREAPSIELVCGPVALMESRLDRHGARYAEAASWS